jgi:hypothetical protein
MEIKMMMISRKLICFQYGKRKFSYHLGQHTALVLQWGSIK